MGACIVCYGDFGCASIAENDDPFPDYNSDRLYDSLR